MDRREFLHRSIFTALAGGMVTLLHGCGGGGGGGASAPVQYQPVSGDFPLVSFDNQNQMIDLFNNAITAGVSPELDQIVTTVTNALTPDQSAYIESLNLTSVSEADFPALVDSLVASFTTTGSNGLLVFTPPAVFANDMQRFAQIFSTLKFGGGLPTEGPLQTITVDSQGNVTPPISSIVTTQSVDQSSAGATTPSPLKPSNSAASGDTVHADQVGALCVLLPPVLCVTLIIKFYITVIILLYVKITKKILVWKWAQWDHKYELMWILVSLWFLIVIYQTKLVTIAQTICAAQPQGCPVHPQGGIGP